MDYNDRKYNARECNDREYNDREYNDRNYNDRECNDREYNDRECNDRSTISLPCSTIGNHNSTNKGFAVSRTRSSDKNSLR